MFKKMIQNQAYFFEQKMFSIIKDGLVFDLSDSFSGKICMHVVLIVLLDNTK